MSQEIIDNATLPISLKNSIPPGFSLLRIRKILYRKMGCFDRANIDPSQWEDQYILLLRVCHQIRVWMQLNDRDIDPLSLEWKVIDRKYYPSMTKIKADSPDIMKIILSIRSIISTTWFGSNHFLIFFKDQVHDFWIFGHITCL